MNILYEVIDAYIDNIIAKKREKKNKLDSSPKRLSITEQIEVCHYLEDINKLKLLKEEFARILYYINEIENKE